MSFLEQRVGLEDLLWALLALFFSNDAIPVQQQLNKEALNLKGRVIFIPRPASGCAAPGKQGGFMPVIRTTAQLCWIKMAIEANLMSCSSQSSRAIGPGCVTSC